MPEPLSPESAEAVHKAKSAAQAIEAAREAQLAELAQRTSAHTEEAILRSLQKVFGMDGGDKSPREMRVLVQRIPILCTMIVEIDKRIEKIDNNLTWGVRIVVGAVIVAVITMVLK